MPASTANTAKPLSVRERKALVARLVESGKLSPRQAGLIGEQGEIPAALLGEAHKLLPIARRGLARAHERKAA
jgi:hypothetical protein